MPTQYTLKKYRTLENFDTAAEMIARLQTIDGAIPWSYGGKLDPWDLIESAMGLSIGGYLQEAFYAFEWMRATQLNDGSWYSAYQDGQPVDRTRETHFAAYIAVGVYHYYLITRDDRFLAIMWPMVQKALNFVIRLQAPGGEVYWAISPEGRIDHMALLTGSSSIFMSLKCGLALADCLKYSMPEWKNALHRLARALRRRPHAFNMTKSRFAMDWFYPVLSGALTGDTAQRRIDQYWKKFVINDHGVRCVSDRPWVTMAETAELVVALAAMDRKELAEIVMNWIVDKRFEDGTFWCGYTVPDRVIWPKDKLTWTNAAALIAADALYSLTPACELFNHRFWEAVATP
jgi:hypothetical protein